MGHQPDDHLTRTRRNLPHWQLGGSVYFLTYRCARGRSLSETDRDLVLNNWKYWRLKRYLLLAAVIMPDHVHVLIKPTRKGANEPWFTLDEILHTNKGFTAHEINKAAGQRGAVWQDERLDRIVRDEREFWQTWSYMRDNPARSGLLADADDYPWWFGDPHELEEFAGDSTSAPSPADPRPSRPRHEEPTAPRGAGGPPADQAPAEPATLRAPGRRTEVGETDLARRREQPRPSMAQ